MSSAGRLVLIALLAFVAIVGWVVTFGAWRARQVASGIAWLEPRSFAGLTIVTVGTGGPYENPSRLGPCIAAGAAGDLVLVDAGRAVAEGLRRAGIPVSQPSAVLLTSLLPENVQGLDDLLLGGWIGGREGGLRLIGPAGTRALAAGLEAAVAESARRWNDAVTPGGALPRFEVEEVGDGFGAELGALRVRATAQAASLAWRIESGGHAAVVSGARPGEEAVVAAAREADLLVLPAVYGASVDLAVAGGTPEAERVGREAALAWRLEAAGELAERAGVRRLVLVRVRPLPLFEIQYERAASARYGGDVELADDGDEFVIR